MQELKKGDLARNEHFGLGVITEDQCSSTVYVDFRGRTVGLSAEHVVLVLAQDEQARRQAVFRQELEGESDHFFGSRWEPFYDEPRRQATANLQAVLDADIVHWFSPDHLPADMSRATGIVWPEDCFYFTGPEAEFGMRAVARVNAARQVDIGAVFPYVGNGAQYTVMIHGVAVWPAGALAQIDASVGIAGISFFDCRYGECRDWYQEDARLDFILSAIAYRCGPVKPDAFELELSRQARSVMSEGVSVELPPRLSLENAAILTPWEEGECDDFHFLGPVQEVEAVEMLGRSGWLATTRVCRFISDGPDDPDDFDLPILITDRVWEDDAAPKVGQVIEGSAWLQGYLWR